MPFIESASEFVERHGGHPIDQLERHPDQTPVRENGKLRYKLRGGCRVHLLPDGAVLSNDGTGPIMEEPPQQPEWLITAKWMYHKTFADLAAEDFNTLKAALLGFRDAGGNFFTYSWNTKLLGPQQTSDGTTMLNRIREIVEHHRKEEARLTDEFLALPSVVERRKRRKENEEHAQRRESARTAEVQRIQEITL